MKKLNANNAIAILSLGLIFSVVVAGCGGNDTAESAVTKNAKAGSSNGGAGGGATTSDTKTGSSDSGAGGGSTKSAPSTAAMSGSADGGTGESVTVSDSDLNSTNVNSTKVQNLTKVQMNALTSAQWELVDGYLSASQVASIPTKTIQNLTTAALEGLSKTGTQALSTEQLNSMSKDQLNALISSKELTADQTTTVTARLTELG